VWQSAAWGVEYLRHHNGSCSTGRMGALSMVLLAPVLASVSASLARVGFAAQCAAVAAVTASLSVCGFVLVAEHLR